jgi:transcriptional regulator with XRE-family HTH domain
LQQLGILKSLQNTGKIANETMARGYRLSDDDRAFLRSFLATLGLSQSEFAIAASISQGWLSQLLSGTRTGAEAIVLDRVVGAAQRLLQKRRDSAAITEEDADRLSAQLARSFSTSAPEEPRAIAPPGGAIPFTAANFVKRLEVEREILQCLKKRAFTLAIVGPPQTGVTTTLKWLESQSQQAGFEIASFDCHLAAPLQEPGSFSTDQEVDNYEDAQMQHFLQLLSEHLTATWNLPSFAAEASILSFYKWLRDSLTSGRYRLRLLILDGVLSLGPRNALLLLRLVRTIHNEQANMSLNIALGIHLSSPIIYERITRSPQFTVINPRISLDWFSRDEVLKLTTAFLGSGGEENAPAADATLAIMEKLYLHYRGQPYLTQLALDRISDRIAKDEMLSPEDAEAGVYQEAVGLSSEGWGPNLFQLHKEAIERSLAERKQGAEDFKGTFHKICKGVIKGTALQRQERVIKYLRYLRLINDCEEPGPLLDLYKRWFCPPHAGDAERS